MFERMTNDTRDEVEWNKRYQMKIHGNHRFREFKPGLVNFFSPTGKFLLLQRTRGTPLWSFGELLMELLANIQVSQVWPAWGKVALIRN